MVARVIVGCIVVIKYYIYATKFHLTMDGQETWIFCGSCMDPYLFLQLQWVSNAILGCLGATMAVLSLLHISPIVQYLIHI
jgi:hypothetical protein